MTAMVTVAVVAAPPVATCKTTPTTLQPAAHQPAALQDDLRFAALSMLESGNNDSKPGRDGEVSRYQITRDNWTSYAGRLDPSNPFTALNCANVIMRERACRFFHTHDREPTAAEWYLLWHRPSRVDHPRPVEGQRAQQFANLLSTLNSQPSPVRHAHD